MAAPEAEARQVPQNGLIPSVLNVRAELRAVDLVGGEPAVEYTSPATDGLIARYAAILPRHRLVEPAILNSPRLELPSVATLKDAPAYAPVRLNSAPPPSIQSDISVMPETRPFLFAANGLKRQTGCLALAIYYEARGEDHLGQIAVAQVILNRVKSRKYPDTICRVVFQNAHWHNRCQFSFACDGRMENPRNRQAWLSAVKLARQLNCQRTCRRIPRQLNPLKRLTESLQRATHYHADYVSPGWARRLERAEKIGRHIFYISRRVWS